MKADQRKPETKENKKADFFKTVLNDKRAMHDYIRKHGSLEGFKSTHFEFAKPI